MNKFGPKPKTIQERFFKFVNKTRTCWLWTGGTSTNGYGCMTIGSMKDGTRKPARSHRISWEIHNGKIPKNLFVLHKCDVRACVNPDHLWLGTLSDNMKDCAKKGRNIIPRHIGESHPNAKLKDGDIPKIREMHRIKKMSHKRIAEAFKVGEATICDILRRATWIHI